ncbi:hypothetical protein PoB_001360600 [Plakobranchus ocellatus]|uniref:Uncharacterized protein n=1 Tax=Plakobranchus ocellatus TaxID=259542 RepID=A0AAV3YXJ4_9GAST|nr:hypothetical protein PoB_001360600 [Plakobranchus ocellatus]
MDKRHREKQIDSQNGRDKETRLVRVEDDGGNDDEDHDYDDDDNSDGDDSGGGSNDDDDDDDHYHHHHHDYDPDDGFSNNCDRRGYCHQVH